MRRYIEIVLAVIGASAAIFPLFTAVITGEVPADAAVLTGIGPALLLIDLSLFGLVGLAGNILDAAERPGPLGYLTWAAVGGLVVALLFGFFRVFMMVALAGFAIAALLADFRRKREGMQYLLVLGAAGVINALILFGLIRL
ncbi:MAG: hypothetical protein Kow00124_19980 [Anaerolineae bacterium]